jgi:quinolinate synthase
MQTATISFDRFNSLADKDAGERIRAARAKLGDKVVLLCHHYQRADVYAHADITGDSLKLSRLASQSKPRTSSSAACISWPRWPTSCRGPSRFRSCPTSPPAARWPTWPAWPRSSAPGANSPPCSNPDEKVTPVTYINSAADLKAFCGEHGGIVCTSSNAPKILDWAFAQREKVLFFPDQHLGRWSGFKMGIPLDEMVIWNPDLEQGGLTREQIAKAKIILWHGYCSVHQMFQPRDIIKFRNQYPDGLVISHPECSFEVCKQSDYIGSTETILQTVKAAAAQHALAGRHRTQPGPAPGRGSEARRQDRAVHGQHHLHVLDHAAHRPAAPGLDPGKPGRRQGRQPDQGARARSRAGQGRAGTFAASMLAPVPCHRWLCPAPRRSKKSATARNKLPG